MEFFKNMLWNIRGYCKRRSRMRAAWSLQKRIIAGAMAGIIVMGGSTGAVLAHHLSDENTQIEFSTAMLHPPVMANVEVYEPTRIEIPNYIGMNLASDSLEKDLTLYFKSAESSSRIEGVAFQVKLISPKNENALADSLDKIEQVNEGIASAKEDGSENHPYEGNDVEGKLTIGEKLLLDKQTAIQEYATALTGVDGKSYVDDDADGMIYINKIESGKYIACMVPTGFYDPSDYATEVTVKDKVEYKKVENIKDKVKKDVEDEKPAEAAPQEAVLQDTVEFVESSKTQISGGFIEAKPAALTPSVSGTDSQSKNYTVTTARRATNRLLASIQNALALSVVHAEEINENPNTGNGSEGQNPPPTQDSTDPPTTPADSGTPTPTPTQETATLTVPETATLYAHEGLNSISADISFEHVNGVVVTSDNSAINASIDGNKVTITGTVNTTSDATASLTYTATCADGQTTFEAHTSVKLVGANTSLKSEDGKDLFVDKEGKTPATLATYDLNSTYYVAGDQPEYKYTGWQTIDGKTYFYNKEGVAVTGDQVIQGVQYSFNGLGVLVPKEGIDVSKWQGNIDWATASSYINFAIIRCGYRGESSRGLAIDPMFAKNVQGAKANGVRIGLYFYSTAMSEAEAVEEASLAVQCAQQAGGLSLPIYIDMEAGCQAGLSNDQRTAICNAFCATVRNSGYSAGVYANKTWLTSKINTGAISGAEIWVAQYNTTCTYNGAKKMWQYSSKGSIPGISGHVDMNRRY